MSERWCLVFDETTIGEQVDALEKAHGAPAIAIGHGPLALRLAARGISVRDWGKYGISAADASLATTRWLRNWGDARDGGFPSFKEWLRYGDTSLWWWMDSWLVESAYFLPLHDSIRMLDQCCDVLDTERLTRIIDLGASNGRRIALVSACAARAVPVDAVGRVRTRAPRRPPHPLMAVGKLGRFVARQLVYSAQDAILGLSSRRKVRARRVLVFSGDNWQRVYDPATQSMTNGDLHLHGVLDFLRQDHVVAFVAYLRPYALSLRAVRAKASVRDTGLAYKTFEAYASVRVYARALREFLRFHRKWASLRLERTFWTGVRYRGVPAGHLLQERLDAFFGVVALEALLVAETGREAVAREAPNVILVTGESRGEARSLLLAGRARGLPTIALQHGRFAPHHFGLAPGDRPRGDLVRDYPLPDCLAVYGNDDRVLLGHLGVPEDRIVVTGAPRWDIVSHLAALYDRRLTCIRYGLDPGRPIVLLTTTEIEEGALVVEEVAYALREVSAAQLVVKLHPAERSNAVYRRAVDRAGLGGVVFCQYTDLYELLYASDILVSPVSTTLSDAAIVGRPPILVDPLRRGHAAIFGNHPAIAVAYNRAELTAHLRFLLNDQVARERALAACMEFATLHAFRLDGRAYERVGRIVADAAEGRTVEYGR